MKQMIMVPKYMLFELFLIMLMHSCGLIKFCIRDFSGIVSFTTNSHRLERSYK